MKKLFIAACLLLCIKAYAQNVAYDSAFITYKDSVNGISFKYPAQWDSTRFNQMRNRDIKTTANFGTYIKTDQNIGEFIDEIFAFFTFRNTIADEEQNIDTLLEDNKPYLLKTYPNINILESEIKTSKNGLKYIFLLVKIPTKGYYDMPTILNAEFVKGAYIGQFSFTCTLDSVYQNLKSTFQEVIDSFQFDK